LLNRTFDSFIQEAIPDNSQHIYTYIVGKNSPRKSLSEHPVEFR